MSLRRLPVIENLERPEDEEDVFPASKEMDEWRARNVRLAETPKGVVIDILEAIGKNFFGEGVGTKDVQAKLKDATGDIVVNINSPGGSYFEGAAIYSLLQQYSGKVIVNILGVAASAASVIAMAGDEIRISPAAGIMIHNAQAMIGGDRHDMEDAADTLGGIDKAIRNIYAARTGQTDGALDKMMTPLSGTWLFGKDAIDKGFADALLPDGAVVKDPKPANGSGAKQTRNMIDAMLAAKGLSRRERRNAFRNLFAERGGHEPETVDSGVSLAEIADMIRNIGKPEKVA